MGSEKRRQGPGESRPAPKALDGDKPLRDRVAELEQQLAALRFASSQGDLVREQFADLYDYAPVGYLTVDGEGVIRRTNVPAAALLGGSRQELGGRKLVTLVRPADKAAFTAFVKAAFTATGPTSIEVALVRGKWRAEHLQFVAAPASTGRDLGHPGAQARLAVLDVTDRRRAEDALRESRDRFRAVIASMAEGVVVHDATGAIRECNVAAQRILGLPEEQLLGRKSVDPRWHAVHEDGSRFPGDQHPAMEVLRTGASRWNVPMGVHRPDGTLVWLRVNADPLRNPDGSVRGAVATFTDVTDREEMEKAVAASERRYRDVVEGMPDGLFVHQDGKIVLANAAAARLLGRAGPEALVGTASTSHVHPSSLETVQKAIRLTLAGEPPPPHDVMLATADGEERVVEAASSLVQFDGRPALQVVLRDVTAERRLRSELDRALRETRHHVENTPLGVVEWDGDYRVTRFSARAEEILGWTGAEVLGKRIDEVPWVPEEDWPIVRAVMRDMDSRARPVNVSANRNRRKDGRVVHCEWFNSGAYGADGKLASVFSLVQDVTARVEAETEIERGRAKLEEVLEASTDGYFDVDLVRGRWFRSARMNELHGAPRRDTEIPFEGWEAEIHPDDRARLQAIHVDVREGRRERAEFRYQCLRPGTSSAWRLGRLKAAARDAAGRATRIVGTVSDVDGEVAAWKAVVESEARQALLIEHAPAAIAMFDREMRYLAASQRWVKAHDLTGKDYVGHVIYDVHPGIPDRWRQAHRRCLAGEALSEEMDQVAKGLGRTETVRWEIQPWRAADGEVGGVVMFSETVTEQRALQARLMAASKLEALGTLVGGMAHEINNPLAAEMAQSVFAAELIRKVREEIAADGSISGKRVVGGLDEALDALGDARESSQRIAAIVRDLVKFGRHDRGRERLRLRSVVDDALRWLPAVQSSRAAIRLEDAGAPDVTAVASQILQVVVSLVTNACQAIPEGRRGTVTVRLGPGAPGTSRIEVEDDGAGMAPDVLSRAFDPFYTTRGVGRGMGLGLSVAHAIAEGHGGTLTATSEPGKGSTFRLELPVAAPED